MKYLLNNPSTLPHPYNYDSFPTIYILITTNRILKYLSLFSLFYGGLNLNHIWFVSTWKGAWKARQAMKHHESQMIWFRELYVILSRYMIINELKRLTNSSCS